MNEQNYLVIGASGKTGRRVMAGLKQRGLQTRGVSRSTDPRFDWNQPSTWDKALEGITAAYVTYSPDLAVPQAPQQITELMAAFHKHGVHRVVLLSGRGESNAQRCEDIVMSSGLKATVVRASWFNQNFSEGHLLGAVLSGTLAMPAGNIAEPFVDVDDVADVALAALIDDRHVGERYDITGPELLTFTDAAAHLTEFVPHKVEYHPISLEAFYEGTSQAVGPEYATMLTELCREVFDGRNANLGAGVQRALGRAPRSFVDYCRRVAASQTWAQGEMGR